MAGITTKKPTHVTKRLLGRTGHKLLHTKVTIRMRTKAARQVTLPDLKQPVDHLVRDLPSHLLQQMVGTLHAGLRVTSDY